MKRKAFPGRNHDLILSWGRAESVEKQCLKEAEFTISSTNGHTVSGMSDRNQDETDRRESNYKRVRFIGAGQPAGTRKGIAYNR
jgi:hypothetical protein